MFEFKTTLQKNNCRTVSETVRQKGIKNTSNILKYGKTIYLLIIFQALFSCQKTDTLPLEKRILQFEFSGVKTAEIQIDDTDGEIRILVPYGISVKSLIPVFTLTSSTTSVPVSGKPQDFSTPIHYILTAADGSKTAYTVRVNTAPQPVPQISGIEKDTLEAGQLLRVTGRYFGNFALDAAVHLVSTATGNIPLPVQAIDSTSLTLVLPVRTPPGSYRINVQIKNAVTVSAQSVVITLPPPQIIRLPGKQLLPGDTLWMETDFTDYLRAVYRLQLRAENNRIFALSMNGNATPSFGFLIPIDFPAGRYGVGLLNVSQAKKSAEWSELITVYDRTKPFVRDILSPQESYQPGEILSFSTLNMAASTARFYQITFTGPQKTVIQNAVFDVKKQQLYLTIPTALLPGNYHLSVRFIHDNSAIDYSVALDRTLTIR